jgi:hypothetical protein
VGRGSLGRLELVALIAAALYALWFQVRAPARTVDDGDYQQVGEVLAHEAKAGDAVLLYPWWTERARLFVPAWLTTVGYLDEAKDELIDHPRIWVLAQPDQPRADLDGFLKEIAPGRTAVGEARRFGKLWLRLYSNDRFRPAIFRATDEDNLLTGEAHRSPTVDYSYGNASAYIEQGGQRSDCQLSGGPPSVFRCPNGTTIASEWHELFYAPQRCLMMHPPGGAGRTVLDISAVPSAPLLRLSAGIIWEHAWKHESKYTPVHLVVEEAGAAQPLAALTIVPGEEGLRSVDVPLTGTEPHHLRLSTQSDNPEERDVCVQLTAYGDAR